MDTKMTPNELRKWADWMFGDDPLTRDVPYAAADAWEKALFVAAQRSIDDASTIDSLQAHIEMLAKAYGMVRWKIPHTNWDVMNAAQELYQAALAGRPAQQVAEADRAYVPYKCDCVICQMLSKLFGPAAPTASERDAMNYNAGGVETDDD